MLPPTHHRPSAALACPVLYLYAIEMRICVAGFLYSAMSSIVCCLIKGHAGPCQWVGAPVQVAACRVGVQRNNLIVLQKPIVLGPGVC